MVLTGWCVLRALWWFAACLKRSAHPHTCSPDRLPLGRPPLRSATQTRVQAVVEVEVAAVVEVEVAIEVAAVRGVGMRGVEARVVELLVQREILDRAAKHQIEQLAPVAPFASAIALAFGKHPPRSTEQT